MLMESLDSNLGKGIKLLIIDSEVGDCLFYRNLSTDKEDTPFEINLFSPMITSIYNMYKGSDDSRKLGLNNISMIRAVNGYNEIRVIPIKQEGRQDYLATLVLEDLVDDEFENPGNINIKSVDAQNVSDIINTFEGFFRNFNWYSDNDMRFIVNDCEFRKAEDNQVVAFLNVPEPRTKIYMKMTYIIKSYAQQFEKSFRHEIELYKKTHATSHLKNSNDFITFNLLKLKSEMRTNYLNIIFGEAFNKMLFVEEVSNYNNSLSMIENELQSFNMDFNNESKKIEFADIYSQASNAKDAVSQLLKELCMKNTELINCIRSVNSRSENLLNVFKVQRINIESSKPSALNLFSNKF